VMTAAWIDRWTRRFVPSDQKARFSLAPHRAKGHRRLEGEATGRPCVASSPRAIAFAAGTTFRGTPARGRAARTFPRTEFVLAVSFGAMTAKRRVTKQDLAAGVGAHLAEAGHVFFRVPTARVREPTVAVTNGPARGPGKGAAEQDWRPGFLRGLGAGHPRRP